MKEGFVLSVYFRNVNYKLLICYKIYGAPWTNQYLSMYLDLASSIWYSYSTSQTDSSPLPHQDQKVSRCKWRSKNPLPGLTAPSNVSSPGKGNLDD